MKFSNEHIITLAEKLGQLLIQKKLKLATAESCTGGGIAYAITSISGSSQWFDRGYITYSNFSKEELLNVRPSIIERYGAVSEETAKAMAKGALKNSRADICMSVTGIAGPHGGSPEKPVGTVWFAIARKTIPVITRYKLFTGDRTQIRLNAIQEGLAFLLSTHHSKNYLKDV